MFLSILLRDRPFISKITPEPSHTPSTFSVSEAEARHSKADVYCTGIERHNVRTRSLRFCRFFVFSAERFRRRFFDLLFLAGTIVPIRFRGRDFVHRFHSLHHGAESGVIPVEKFPVRVHDEELRAGGIGHLRPRHRQDAALMGNIVRLKAVVRKFALNVISGTARSRAFGIAALDHKARDDAVKDKPVIKTFLYEGQKIFDRIGALSG